MPGSLTEQQSARSDEGFESADDDDDQGQNVDDRNCRLGEENQPLSHHTTNLVLPGQPSANGTARPEACAPPSLACAISARVNWSGVECPSQLDLGPGLCVPDTNPKPEGGKDLPLFGHYPEDRGLTGSQGAWYCLLHAGG